MPYIKKRNTYKTIYNIFKDLGGGDTNPFNIDFKHERMGI